MTARFPLPFFLIHAKGQKNVPRPTDYSAVAGTEIEHSVDHGSSAQIHGAAVGFHAVHRLKLAIRVEFPDHGAVFRGVGAHTTICRARKNHAGYRRDGSGLGRAAAGKIGRASCRESGYVWVAA